MTLEERFAHDNRFRGLVNAIRDGLTAKDYTTDDLHAAIVLAQQIVWDAESPEEKLRRAVGKARAHEVLSQSLSRVYPYSEYDIDGSLLPRATTPATTQP